MPPVDQTIAEAPRTRKVSLYAARVKPYPRFLNQGTFRRVKWIAVAVLLALYWLGPWLRWDRGAGAPDQAILIDLPGRRAYFFFIEIWPQEVYYLTGLLIIAALALFFASALLGRVWCGFACWQTVWTDLYVWIEQLFEGDRNRRIRLDKAPWSVDKAMRKLGKHAVWIALSLLTGYGFILYFADAPHQTADLLSGKASVNAYGFMLLFSAFPYLLAGFAREQVCIYMCPYSRFQSAMLDEHSLIVSYEAWRGEPRGHLTGSLKGRATEQVFAGRGHCVDCGLCVQVCPTGIDIRNGSQLACIGCALCVDACNSVMDRFGLPRGLISYDSSFNQVARANSDSTARTRVWRPRVFIYLALIATVMTVMASVLATRHSFDVNILHERQPVYVELPGQRLRNGYTLKILNMVRRDGHFRLSLDGVANATMAVIGIDGDGLKTVDLAVPADDVGTFHLFVTAPKASLSRGKADLTMILSDLDTGAVVRHRNLFAGPED
jgi:cytochrome c oxidase accessory protein FixG